MKRWLLLSVSLCGLLGCAPAIAPLPPLTTLVPNSPPEWRVVVPQWQTGTVATYNIERFFEARFEDRVKTWRERHVVQLRSVGRTAQGYIRMRFAYDGEELGEFAWDDDGLPTDVLPTHPAHLAVFRRHIEQAGNVDLRGLDSTTLRRGEPVSMVLPLAPYAQALSPEVRAGLAENVVMEVALTGYVRLGVAVAVALRETISTFLKDGPFLVAKGRKGEEWCDEVGEENSNHYDASSGYLLAAYSVATVSGHVAEHPFRLRIIEQQTLDRAHSSGL